MLRAISTFNIYIRSVKNIGEIKPNYDKNPKLIDGREIINNFFNITFKNNPLVFAVGEDVGMIGGVNQGFAGIQEKYGKLIFLLELIAEHD